VKQERGCALVWRTRKGSGRLTTRLTTPLRSRAFFLRRSGAGECKMLRSETDSALCKLANLIEVRLPDIFRELLIESRAEHAQSVCYSGCNFIESLREAADGKGGDA
jgi:hypothetical protein